jgi:hypothetical protein
MAPLDVNTFLLRVLCPAGFASSPTGRGEDLTIEAASVAVVEQGHGPWHPEHSGWLQYAKRSDGVAFCWLAGHPQGELASPPGWKAEDSSSYVRLGGDLQTKPVESVDALPPVPGGYLRLFQGRAYRDDDSTQ